VRSSDAQDFETVVYEGYGPGGVAVIVEALTDNRNRTASDVRHAFDKNDGNLGTSGAVAWLFERPRRRARAGRRRRRGRAHAAAAEGGADDVALDGSTFEIVSAPEALTAVREAVEAAGFSIDSGGADDAPEDDRSRSGRVVREENPAPDRPAGGERRRAGRLRELRHPRAGPSKQSRSSAAGATVTGWFG
jgi:transcriptional/translational regulatory protein YebC/TACO1